MAICRSFVNFDYVAEVARLNAASLGLTGSGSGASRLRVKMLTKELENDTHLTWEPSAGAASYEVVWRATSSRIGSTSQTVAVPPVQSEGFEG